VDFIEVAEKNLHGVICGVIRRPLGLRLIEEEKRKLYD
jgi:hypothetical protein